MRKINKILLLFVLTIAFIVESNISVEAKGLIDNRVILDQGTTEEGINYVVYLHDFQDEISSNIVVSKKFTIDVLFDGNIKPSDTWSAKFTEGTVTYSGTLYLQSYYFDNLFSSKKTVATYSGTLCGLL